jgi:hypothetical protein
MVVAVDDADPIALIRLFNEPAGREYLARSGVPAETVGRLDSLGISGCGNLCAAIKLAKWYELDEHDIVFTVFTDSMDLYRSRLEESRASDGPFDAEAAAVAFHGHLAGLKTDSMVELDHWGRRRVHSLKYYTWVEQQGKDVAELNAQWDDWRAYWPERFGRAAEYDRLIEAFNERVASGG